MFCTNCDKENNENAKFCIACGNSLVCVENDKEGNHEKEKLLPIQARLQDYIFNNKKIVYIVIVFFIVCVLLLLGAKVKKQGINEELLEIKTPTAPLNIESEKIHFLGNAFEEGYTIIKKYNEDGDLLFEAKEDAEGNQLRKIDYIYEEDILVRADVYEQNELIRDIRYELDEDGYIYKETGYPILEPGSIWIPEYTTFYSYDENHILVLKETSGESARWEYYPEERIEKYSEGNGYQLQLKYYVKYDVLENISYYAKYDENGNIVFSEEYVNQVTYDEDNRITYCESYVDNTKRIIREINYFN